MATLSTVSLLLLAILVSSSLARVDPATDVNCPDQNGHCYNCLYHDGTCFRSDTCMVYKNGNIFTVSSKDNNWSTQPQKTIIIRDGKIVFVGTDEAGTTYLNDNQLSGPRICRVIDLKGRTVLPGLHDVHMHPLEASSQISGTCKLKKDTWPNKGIFVDVSCTGKQKGTDWILGHGFSISAMMDYLRSADLSTAGDPRSILDSIIPDKPAIMMEETSHSVWVNSKALKEANLDGPNPANWIGSKVMLNSSGFCNGIILESAGNILLDMALDPGKYPSLLNYSYTALKSGLSKLASNGLTSFVDARAFYLRQHHLAYQRAERENNLTSRSVLSLWAYVNEENDEKQIRDLKKLFFDPPTGNLRMTQVKVYSDGLIGTMTARVMNNYLEDKLNLGIGLQGINYFTQERLSRLVAALQSFRPDGRGFDFHAHTVGDRAVFEVLNAYEQSHNNGTRHRCTHVEIVSPGDIARFKPLNVIADAQVANDFTKPGDPSRADVRRLVGDIETNFVPIKSLQDSGARVTLSSDWDVSSVNPFVGMSNALHRDPQSVDLKTALAMYTINGAYVMRQEDKVGSLEVGKEADLIIVDRNIFDLERSKDWDGIKATKVLNTVVAGEEIFRSNEF